MNPYKEEEENIVLKLYSKANNLQIEEKIFQDIKDFSIKYENIFRKKLYLSQKINILKIASNFSQKNHNKNDKNYIILIIYMIRK